jgi:hypothetical protein
MKGASIRIVARFSACDGEVRPFLIVENGDNERLREQSAFLVGDSRTGGRSPVVFLGCAS